MRSSVRVLACAVTVCGLGLGIVANGNGTAAAPNPVQPQRLLDTRVNLGHAGRLMPGETLALPIPVAAGATSVALNLTADQSQAPGFITAWPCGTPMPNTSILNMVPGQAVANMIVVNLPAAGVCFATSTPTHLIADLNGSFTGTSDITTVVPNRVVDTRSTGNPLGAGEVRSVSISGTPGIPASASVAALNITVTGPVADGFLVAYPCGSTPPNASTVNFRAGEDRPNFTVVLLTAGKVCLRSSVATGVIVDTFGWSSNAGGLRALTPARILDTRQTAAWPYGVPVSPGAPLALRVADKGGVANDASAALLTITVDNAPSSGFVTAWPCDQPQPNASTLNLFAGVLRSNLALVKLSATAGTVCLAVSTFDGAPVHLIVDAVGSLTGGPARAAPPPDPPPPGATTCGLTGPAFCENFNAPAGGGTRTGDLDPVLWGVSRVGNVNPGKSINDIPQVSMSGCGTTAWTMTPSDVRICDGKLFESVNDGGGVVNLNTYPKQPFNFAGRTGKVTFDVSADSDGSHAAWPEFVITDKPVPGVRSSISFQQPAAAINEIGFSLDGGCSGNNSTTGVGLVFMTNNGVYSEPSFTATGCVTKGTANALNHFEVRVSQTRLEVWGTNPGGGTLTQLAVANVNLGFTQGLVWLDDVHYNARKAVEPCACGDQWNHTFVWDNLGFDGPKTYRDLGFDVPDPNVAGQDAPSGDPTRRTGFQIGTGPVTLSVSGVHSNQTPTAAQVVLNTYSFGAVLPSVSVNGGPWIDTPGNGPTFLWRSLSIPVPLAQIHDGVNTLSFKSGDGSTVITNISLILVAAASVP